jgi:hypothetical protein
MQEIFGNDRLYERFFNLLEAGNPRDRLYVYRLERYKPVKPAIYKGRTFPDLLEFLRDTHLGGEFQVMIRRGEKMLLVGAIAVAPPPSRNW